MKRRHQHDLTVPHVLEYVAFEAEKMNAPAHTEGTRLLFCLRFEWTIANDIQMDMRRNRWRGDSFDGKPMAFHRIDTPDDEHIKMSRRKLARSRERIGVNARDTVRQKRAVKSFTCTRIVGAQIFRDIADGRISIPGCPAIEHIVDTAAPCIDRTPLGRLRQAMNGFHRRTPVPKPR